MPQTRHGTHTRKPGRKSGSRLDRGHRSRAMTLFLSSVFSCAQEPPTSIPEQMDRADLGRIYPPMAGRYNAFSSKFGVVYQDEGCFVLWNAADREGRVPRVAVSCPPEQPRWSGCDGLMLALRDGSCRCQPLESSAEFVVSCPESK